MFVKAAIKPRISAVWERGLYQQARRPDGPVRAWRLALRIIARGENLRRRRPQASVMISHIGGELLPVGGAEKKCLMKPEVENAKRILVAEPVRGFSAIATRWNSKGRPV